MDSTIMELHLYLNNSEEIIDWLVKEGVKTKDEALLRLQPYVKLNMYSWASSVASGNVGSLAGTSNCINNVVKYFENKEKNESKSN